MSKIIFGTIIFQDIIPFRESIHETKSKFTFVEAECLKNIEKDIIGLIIFKSSIVEL